MIVPNILFAHNKAVRDNFASIYFIKEYLAMDDILEAVQAMSEISLEDRLLLNIATTKGGIFTVDERNQFMSPEWKKAWHLDNPEAVDPTANDTSGPV